MKTLLQTTCATLGMLLMIISAHADTSAISPNLSTLSVKIGAKTYSGEEAKTLLLSRVKTMENARKTSADKQKFLEQFNTKLSKLAGAYEKRGGKAGDVARVLRAVEIELKKNTTSGDTHITSPKIPSNSQNTVNSTSQTKVVYNGTDGREDAGLMEMLSLAKTQQQTFYVHKLYEASASMPSVGWKDKNTAINYLLDSSGETYKKYPITIKAIIVQAVNDFYERKFSNEQILESFKTLPTINE